MLTAWLVLVLLCGIPTALWTGALTPVLMSTGTTETNSLKISQYSINSEITWSKINRIEGDGCATITNELGASSACPVQTISSSVLQQAAQASSLQSRTHAMIDNSLYSYLGRSYGIGSTVGLVDQHLYGGPNSSNLQA